MAFASAQETDFSALDSKLENFGLQGDYEVYAFDEYDGLGDQLEENLDDFNADTFGGDLPVSRDFDFSKTGGGSWNGNAQPAPQREAAPASNTTKFNLDSDSLLGPRQTSAAPPKAKTLAEIEAEMMQMQVQPAQKTHFRTLEEIEAEIMQKPSIQSQPVSIQHREGPLQGQGRQVPQFQQFPPIQGNLPQIQAQQAQQGHQPRQSVDLNLLLAQQAQLHQQQQASQQAQNLMQQRPQRMHQSNLTINQLHNLRGQLLSRPQTAEIAAEVGRIEQVIHAIEHEENVRRRRMQKIADMSHYNNVMWNSEKDFITRIQLSQLLNTAGPSGEHDPLKDDFYFTVFQHLRGVKAAALQNAQQAVQQGGNRGGKRKLLAVQKMAQQVQRIVEDARKKPRATQLSLDGALGKIALRSRSAPRQLLQMAPSANSIINEANNEKKAPTQKPALTQRQVLLSLEKLYDIVLEMEQVKRALAVSAVDESGETLLEENKVRYAQLGHDLWQTLCATEPLDISNPHPFISLLAPVKGKKLLPRILRHTSQQQSLTLFTLLLATFQQLDVVRNAPFLDMPAENAPPQRALIARDSDLFLGTVVPGLLGMLDRLPLRVLTGMFSLLVTRNSIQSLGSSRAGIAVLTVFLSHAQILRQGIASDDTAKPNDAEIEAWTNAVSTLFNQMQGQMLRFFPSTRIAAALPFGASLYLAGPANSMLAEADSADEPVWTFFAAVAVSADMHQQQALVTELREKVLESVNAVAKKWVSPEIGERKIVSLVLCIWSTERLEKRQPVDARFRVRRKSDYSLAGRACNHTSCGKG